MTITAIEPSAQAAPQPEAIPDDRAEMLESAADILSQIEDALGKIDTAAERISALADELHDLDGLPEEAQEFASDISGLDLTDDPYRCVRRLRAELDDMSD